jgi:phosphoglycolate phosphatase
LARLPSIQNSNSAANFNRVIAGIEKRIAERSLKDIIYDFDGVLVNSRRMNAQNVLQTLDAYIGALRGRGLRLAIINGSMEELCSRHSPDTILSTLVPGLEMHPGLMAEIKKQVGDLAIKNSHLILPSPLVDKLPEYNDRGIRQAIATNRMDSAMPLIKAVGIEKHFVAIVDSLMAREKPHPEMIWLAMWMMGADPKYTLFIGDNKEDFEAGKNAGVETMRVQWRRE